MSNRKLQPAILIRESYREGGKVKTRIIINITRRPHNYALIPGGNPT
ncbi:MAG: hypothetical protein J7M18_00675 [Candidatus Eremiobacteraeota bacterium]|nr:hypothetical protein [Candidatus Eremiobacteraeota bacterium]